MHAMRIRTKRMTSVALVALFAAVASVGLAPQPASAAAPSFMEVLPNCPSGVLINLDNLWDRTVTFQVTISVNGALVETVDLQATAGNSVGYIALTPEGRIKVVAAVLEKNLQETDRLRLNC